MPTNEPSGYTWNGADGPGMLRRLREDSGLSQYELANRLIEADIKIDQAHVQKIESGRIRRPSSRTIEVILTHGLQMPFAVRRDVLRAYGYELPWTLPTDREIEFQRRVSQRELDFSVWPSYIMDLSHRIWGWNRYFPRLLGNTADDARNADYLGLTVLDILLNPEVGTNRQIANATSFVPISVAWFKTATRAHVHASWFLEFMEKAGTWPGFREMWEHIPEEAPVLWEEPPTIPVEIHVPGYDMPLRFRPMHLELPLDPRFSILHLVPLNLETMAICMSWAAETPGGLP